MAAELVWRPQARHDLLEIYLSIGSNNPAAAERLYARIESRAGMLAFHPRLGPRRPEIRRSARILIEGAYLILYEIHPDEDDGPVNTVEIVRVVDGRRDLAAV